jgi:hypothetical protein
MAMSRQHHERIMVDLYNGEDGKSGLVAEFRTFIISWNTRNFDADKRRSQAWRKWAVWAVVGTALLAYPVDRAWHIVTDVIHLTEEWKTYTPVPTADSQPKVQHKSFFRNPPRDLEDSDQNARY